MEWLYPDAGLLILRTLTHVSLLVKELETFSTRATESHQQEARAAWRESEQNDLVLGLAVAAWVVVQDAASEDDGGVLPALPEQASHRLGSLSFA